MKIEKFFAPLLFAILIALIASSCARERKTGYEMMAEVRDITINEDDTTKPIYLTGTKPIDSVDVHKLIYDIWRIEIDEYPDNLKIYARVYDSTGNFVTNMANPYKDEEDTNTYFTSVTETLGKVYKKREVPIDSFHVREFGAGDSIPYNIVLSVDYSGSMKQVMNTIYEGTELFVSMKMTYDKIALTSFSEEYDLKVPLLKDSSRILNLYRDRRQRGLGAYSAMYNAVDTCMDQYEGTSMDVPRVLVVFSDGDDNESKKEVEELVARAKKEKINMFTVAWGYSKDENLKYLAENTGGKFYKAYTKEELIAIFRDIYMSLRYYYYITYKPPKYWGLHKVLAALNVPPRTDTLFAHGEYDTSDLWKGPGDTFERPILFDFDSAVVKKESYYIIDEIVDVMMANPRIRLEIQGHTDNIGTQEYNQKLSERRAKAVYDEIVKRGIDERRLRWRGFGYSVPKTSNETEEGRAENRRTVFEILAK